MPGIAQVGQAIGLAALATIAAARTNADHGSLARGYQASFLVAAGIAVVAVLIVVIQMRTRTVTKEAGVSVTHDILFTKNILVSGDRA